MRVQACTCYHEAVKGSIEPELGTANTLSGGQPATRRIHSVVVPFAGDAAEPRKAVLQPYLLRRLHQRVVRARAVRPFIAPKPHLISQRVCCMMLGLLQGCCMPADWVRCAEPRMAPRCCLLISIVCFVQDMPDLQSSGPAAGY